MSNNNLNFGRVLLSTEGMGSTAAALAEGLNREIEYSQAISDLDDMGVDVVIISDPKNSEDKAKILFATKDDRLYKIGNKDHMTTGKTFNLGEWKTNDAFSRWGMQSDEDNKMKATEYSTNSDAVLDVAQKIVDGEITKTTTKPTKSVKEMLAQFWIR